MVNILSKVTKTAYLAITIASLCGNAVFFCVATEKLYLPKMVAVAREDVNSMLYRAENEQLAAFAPKKGK